MLRAFRQRFPDVALHLKYAATDQQMELLEAGKLDIAFLSQPVCGHGLTHLPVQTEALGVCMPTFHPLASRASVALPALHDQNWVFGEPALWRQYRRLTDRLFIEAGYAPRIVQEAYNTDCIMGMVAAGLGITLHVRNANARHPDEVVFVPLSDPSPTLVTEAVWQPHRAGTVLARFVGLLGEVAASESA